MTRYFLKLFLALAVFLAAVSSAGIAQMHRNAACPVMPGERTKEKFYLDYQGERIYFCCKGCVKSFKKNPKKYLKNLKYDE